MTLPRHNPIKGYLQAQALIEQYRQPVSDSFMRAEHNRQASIYHEFNALLHEDERRNGLDIVGDLREYKAVKFKTKENYLVKVEFGSSFCPLRLSVIPPNNEEITGAKAEACIQMLMKIHDLLDILI